MIGEDSDYSPGLRLVGQDAMDAVDGGSSYLGQNVDLDLTR